MKFFLEFVTCYRSCSPGKQRPAEETRLLVAQEPRRRVGRKQGRIRGGGREWRPSLSSISEDVLMAERINNIERPAAAEGWRRSLKRKVSSISRRDRSRSLDNDDKRRPPLPTIIPTFSPTPFMF